MTKKSFFADTQLSLFANTPPTNDLYQDLTNLVSNVPSNLANPSISNTNEKLSSIIKLGNYNIKTINEFKLKEQPISNNYTEA
ncbi:30134_t:CDS:2 [Gigaspora margarita]|uniref:30134_t:CDS:1 n=1 Tax=Gigaspora margarita TaxID=4874 RepID=A0ABM8VX31_GIGMA|nr:30134_t:CDS:2 [Gigaspora margarita]